MNRCAAMRSMRLVTIFTLATLKQRLSNASAHLVTCSPDFVPGMTFLPLWCHDSEACHTPGPPIKVCGHQSQKRLSMKNAILLPVAVLAIFAQARADDKVDFTKSIQPILEKRCIECHG